MSRATFVMFKRWCNTMLYSTVSTFLARFYFFIFFYIFKFNHDDVDSLETSTVKCQTSCLVVLTCWCWSSDSEAAEKLSGGHDQRHHGEDDRHWPLTGLARCIRGFGGGGDACVRTASTTTIASGFFRRVVVISWTLRRRSCSVGCIFIRFLAVVVAQISSIAVAVHDSCVSWVFFAFSIIPGIGRLRGTHTFNFSYITCTWQKHNSHRSLINVHRLSVTYVYRGVRPLHKTWTLEKGRNEHHVYFHESCRGGGRENNSAKIRVYLHFTIFILASRYTLAWSLYTCNATCVLVLFSLIVSCQSALNRA